jgi:hypothetical protein
MEDKETQLPSLSPNLPLQAASNTILLVYVTARPNLPYIVCSHNFVLGDASPFLSLTPQNAYNRLVINTTNKASNQLLTRQCRILQLTPLKESDDLVDTIGQPMRLALIPNVTARPNLLYIVRFGSSALTILFLVTRAHF